MDLTNVGKSGTASRPSRAVEMRLASNGPAYRMSRIETNGAEAMTVPN